LVASLSSACLFPSLDFTGGDAAGDATTFDAPSDTGVDAAVDAGSDANADASDAAFHAGIGCDAATPDLLAYYTVDEGSGTIVHDCVSSPKNDGTIQNAAHTSWVTGQHGKALEIDPFDAGAVNVDFAPSFTFGAAPFTVTMWIEILSFPQPTELGYIAGQSSNITAAGWRFSIAPGGVIQLAVPDGKGGISNVTGPPITSVGVWHHVAAVYAGANSLVYLDAKAGSAQTLPTPFTADGSEHMRIGTSSDDQHQLNARVDDVRFYGRALSAGEITIVKNAN
jgi:hypothetical protein